MQGISHRLDILQYLQQNATNCYKCYKLLQIVANATKQNYVYIYTYSIIVEFVLFVCKYAQYHVIDGQTSKYGVYCRILQKSDLKGPVPLERIAVVFDSDCQRLAIAKKLGKFPG